MVRYHISPTTGNPNQCKARPGNCPFGAESEHYPSKEAARSEFEKKQARAHLTGLARPRLETYTLRKHPHLFPETVRGAKAKGTANSLAKFIEASPGRGVDCPECGRPIGGPAEASFLSTYGNSLHCYSCKTYVSSDEGTLALVRPNPDSPTYPAVYSKNVAKMVWYHWTTREDWHEAIMEPTGPDKIHLGGESAAADRSVSLGTRNPSRLYVLELDPTVTVHPELYQDGDSDFTVTDEVTEDVVRYLNRYEDPGSISLLVKPSMVRVKGYRIFDCDEAKFCSTYFVEGVEDYVVAKQEEMELPS